MTGEVQGNLLGATAGAGADIYLSIRTKRAGELKGEASAKGHQNAIAAHGFRFGVSAGSALGSGQATARRQYKQLVVSKRLDSSSTSLMSVLATNDEIKDLRLALRKPGGDQDDFFTLSLSGARVVGLDLDCNEHGETLEQVSFAFTRVEIEYRVQGSDGVLGAANRFSDELLPA
ncbi:Hcp family type VI secretion system effector [Roseateles violae]|uniref:Type VI secretion system tube protein Hcp n=1 Tax=Roseateles violae TaxID=3058042 RepID=A0ABT8DSZ2_9BURK|nr:type VI secretion system tube protein Hcp [Pelomonas sp. PFR6]MDN3920029.1 type VI secretion system tube protein Hcp [Pelomonas sp. PFR6]